MRPMKGKKPTKLFQYCIREHRLEEVLLLDKDITIEELTFEVGMSYRRMNKPISTELKALGVTIIREPAMTIEAGGLLSGTRSAIIKNAKAICKELGLDLRHMLVKRLRLSWENNKMTFTRITKNMEKGDGGTERITMLGLVLRDDLDMKSVNEVIRRLGANKVNCRFDITTVQTVVCSI